MLEKNSNPILKDWSYTIYGMGLSVEYNKEQEGQLRVQGHIYNSPHYEDGEFIVTDIIKCFNDKSVITIHNETFLLSEQADA